MKVRFQADNDLDRTIVNGVLPAEPEIDFRPAQDVPLNGLPDDVVLRLAAGDRRVLVTHDTNTMPTNFKAFRRTNDSPGVLITPQLRSVASAIENLILIWHATDAAEWRNRICYLPTLADFE